MTIYNDQLSEYVSALFAPQDDVLRQVPASSLAHGLPDIQIKAEEGRFLQALVAACSAHKALEIGALGGYSAIWIARGLAPGGKLVSLEFNPLHAKVTRQHLALAGLDGRVEVREGKALSLLPGMKGEGPFDFVFIDADKSNYRAYFDWAIENTRQGAVIAVHNAFWSGAVLRQENLDADTRSIQALNRYAATHPNLISTIYPAGDGTLVCIRI